MGSILADIVDEIDVKPNKTKLILKWVVGISGSLIATAFLLGQLRTKHINRLDRIETNQLEMKVENRNGFNAVNARIDKGYDDGFVIFNETIQDLCCDGWGGGDYYFAGNGGAFFGDEVLADQILEKKKIRKEKKRSDADSFSTFLSWLYSL